MKASSQHRTTATAAPPPAAESADSGEIEVRAALSQRAARWQAECDLLQQQSHRLTRFRTATFWVGLAGLTLIWLGWLPAAAGYTWAGLAVAVWIYFVSRHNRLDVELARAEQHARVNRLGLARLDRRWDALPLPEFDLPAEDRTTCDDLNLFGGRSVFQLLCHAATPAGVRQLGTWLLRGGTRSEVARREEAAAELRPLLDLRQELELRARLLAAGETGPEKFSAWAGAEENLLGTRALWLARAATAATLLLLAAAVAELLPGDLGWALFSLMVVGNIVLTGVFIPRIHQAYNLISSRHNEVSQYRDLFEVMRSMPTGSEQLRRLHDEITRAGADAAARLEELADIMNRADLRRAVILYLPLQLVGLWDLHVAGRLTRWKQTNGRHVPGWFAALGEFEALCSLAALGWLHPDWTFARLEDRSDSPPRLTARRLGHPLLPQAVGVRNDVALGPPGKLLLVTGSNMSGKSTLLRAIGSNVFLAQAGAAVCAEELRLPRLRVLTSMRIQDSLADGVSFFLAELQRLKAIVDAARAIDAQDSGDETLLYLLDEILQGTNSAERFVAVQTVIARLLEAGAIGAVSTHDLKLAEVEPVRSAAEVVHFRERIGSLPEEPEMSFDYRLRPGVATSTNALRLLEMIGLGKPYSTDG